MTASQSPSQETINQFVGAAHGDFATVQALAGQYPDIITANATWNETALGAASQMGNRTILEFLLDRGVELDVFAAAALGMTERVVAFLDGDPSLIQARGVHGFPILWFPVVAGHRDVATILLSRGADVNAGAGGNTALHAAAGFGWPELAGLLLDHGADLAAKDYQGKTPLATALKNGHQDVADLLRQRGATE
jgi:ankyrin repeat protein